MEIAGNWPTRADTRWALQIFQSVIIALSLVILAVIAICRSRLLDSVCRYRDTYGQITCVEQSATDWYANVRNGDRVTRLETRSTVLAQSFVELCGQFVVVTQVRSNDVLVVTSIRRVTLRDSL